MFKDEKGADEGGVLIEGEPSNQGSNEPTDTTNNMASEIPKEDTHNSSPQTEEEPENLQASVESAKESPPKKQVSKNVVSSWSDWVAKTTTTVASVNKETKENTSTSASQPRVKRLAELSFSLSNKLKN